MSNLIQPIALDRLVTHPDNPNRMSKGNFAKLLRNMERTALYEPLIVRPCPRRPGFFQIINGHHRFRALQQLGHKTADVVVWDVDDHQVDVLLATLNRLGGSDDLSKKLKLLRRLNKRFNARELAKLLPQTAVQIERLAGLHLPRAPAKLSAEDMFYPLVFFVNDEQRLAVEEALSLAAQRQSGRSRAAMKSAALTAIAQHFLNTSR